jgi:hypothetical protein
VLTFKSTAASSTSAAVPINLKSTPPGIQRQNLPTLASACLLCLAAFTFAFSCKHHYRYVLFAALLFVVAETCTSCGGSGNGGVGVTGNPGTPIGPVQGLTVSISINGTAKTVPSLSLTVQ